MKTAKILLCLCVAALIQSAAAQVSTAADKKFEISLDRTVVAIGDKAQLGVTFYGTQTMPAPDIGNISGLDVRYVGPSTMMTVLNGQVSTSVTHLYTILPLKLGKFQIGPFAFKYKNDSYTSNTVFLEVAEERAPPVAPRRPASSAPPTPGAVPASVSNEPLDLGDRMFLTLFVDKTVAFVNELIPVTVKLYVNRLNVSDIQLPTFAQEGFSKVEFKEPKQYRERLNGLLYDVLEFKTSIFGTRAGDYRLGPAKIKCNVMIRRSPATGAGLNDDFFGPDPRDAFFDDFMARYERHPMELQSKDVQLGIQPIPAQGRPADYSGAVGDYQFIYTAAPTKLKVGDPVTIKMEINGTGNFNTVLMPKLDAADGFKAYEAQATTEENHKTFTQVLIPESDKVTQVPRAVFSYFDPNARQFKTIDQGPIAITVEKAKDEAPSQVIGPAIAPMPGAPATSELSRDIIYIKESPGRFLTKGQAFYKAGIFSFYFILPLCALVAFQIFQARRSRMMTDSVYAGRVAAFRSSKRGLKDVGRKLKAGEPRDFYEALFKTLQDYLGYRLSIPPAGITSIVAEQELGQRDFDPGLIGRIRTLFTTCDESRFGFQQPDRLKMRGDLRELRDIINYLERKKI